MFKSTRSKMLIVVFIGVAVIILISELYLVSTKRITIINRSSHNFKIKFDNLRKVNLEGTAKEITSPTINTNDTHISNYAVSLTSPGDSISYVFDVVNEGDYNTFIDSIDISNPVCKEISGIVSENSNKVCSNLVYTLSYLDGQFVKSGDKLLRKERKTMILKLYYKNDISPNELAKNDLLISNLDVDIFYTQCDNNNR